MPQDIGPVTTTANYTDNTFQGDWASGYIFVQGNDALVEIVWGHPGARTEKITGKRVYTNQTLNLTAPRGLSIQSIAIKDAVAGSHATVTGYMAEAGSLGLIASLGSTSSSTASVNLAPVALASWPPASPNDGDLAILILPASYDPISGKTIRWLCQYDLGNLIWEVLGGKPLMAKVDTAEANALAAYGDLATIGPAITLPRPGDYDIEIEQTAQYSSATSGSWASVSGAGLSPSDIDSINGIGYIGNSQSARIEKTGLNTSTSLKMVYKETGGATTVSNRHLNVYPVRIT